MCRKGVDFGRLDSDSVKTSGNARFPDAKDSSVAYRVTINNLMMLITTVARIISFVLEGLEWPTLDERKEVSIKVVLNCAKSGTKGHLTWIDIVGVDVVGYNWVNLEAKP